MYRPLWDTAIAGIPWCFGVVLSPPNWVFPCRGFFPTARMIHVPVNSTHTQNPPLQSSAVTTQCGANVLPIVNLMADSESGSPSSYSCFIVTIGLSRLVSEIFTCDRQTNGRTDNSDHYYSWPPHCGGAAKNIKLRIAALNRS